jgi:S1-C subfamily serine protease
MKKLFPIISVLCLMWSGNVFALTLECTEKRQTIPLDGNNVQSGSSGTAFFINSKGYLLTNNHVVEGCKLQQIKYKGKDYEAKILATDKTLILL